MINKKIRFDISEEKALALYNECCDKRKYGAWYNRRDSYSCYKADSMRKATKSLSKNDGLRMYYKGLNCLDERYKDFRYRCLYDFELVRVFWSYDDKCIYLIPRCSKEVGEFWVPRILEILENFVKGEVK